MKSFQTFLALVIFIYFCTDKMMSQWNQIGLASDQVISLAIKSNGYIFAGTYNDGGYKSTDHGSTWIPSLSTGLYSVYELYSLTIDGFG